MSLINWLAAAHITGCAGNQIQESENEKDVDLVVIAHYCRKLSLRICLKQKSPAHDD